MDDDQLKAQIIESLKEKKKIEEKIGQYERELVKKLCPKNKQECEPAYCSFRLSDSCPFLKEWQELQNSIK